MSRYVYLVFAIDSRANHSPCSAAWPGIQLERPGAVAPHYIKLDLRPQLPVLRTCTPLRKKWKRIAVSTVRELYRPNSEYIRLVNSTALTNQHVLERIFNYLPRSSNASNAQVCQAWHQPATHALWRTVDANVFFGVTQGRASAYGYMVRSSKGTVHSYS